MKQALISPTEKVYKYDNTLLGDRVAEVTASPFEVAAPLFWIACPDGCCADCWYYNTTSGVCEQIPENPTVAIPVSEVAQLSVADLRAQLDAITAQLAALEAK
jgi:hypothetical protein